MADEQSVEQKQSIFGKYYSGLKDLGHQIIGDTRRKKIGTGVGTIGAIGILKNVLAIFGIGEFDVTETGFATFLTALGLAIRSNPKNIFGVDAAELADAPKINILELSDEQAQSVADDLGVSLQIFYEAAEFSQMDGETLEAKIREKYGDLIDRYQGKTKGGVSPKEKNLVTCIQHFARLNELIGQGKVVVNS